MYYVIQHRHNDPKKYFSAYVVPKFITSKGNENIIFEFVQPDGGVKRKWTAKKEIILLTDNETVFKEVLARLTVTQNKHLAQIQHAEENLQNEFRELANAMQDEFTFIDKEREKPDFPCIVKSYS
jgi:predicted transcriptional regulator